MSDKPLEFVDESEEPHPAGGASHGRLTGWETVVFLVGDPEDDTMNTGGKTE